MDQEKILIVFRRESIQFRDILIKFELDWSVVRTKKRLYNKSEMTIFDSVIYMKKLLTTLCVLLTVGLVNSACDVSCDGCSAGDNDPTKCDACKDEYFDNAGTCTACVDPCQKCSSATFC